jgi:hypothetical protein
VALRVCAEPGCPTLTKATRCPDCTRAKDKARGTRQERGYDAAYDRERRRYQFRMEAGEVFPCWRCDELGRPHDVDPDWWHLGHDDLDRSIIRGPECPAGNLATSGRRIPPDA